MKTGMSYRNCHLAKAQEIQGLCDLAMKCLAPACRERTTAMCKPFQVHLGEFIISQALFQVSNLKGWNSMG